MSETQPLPESLPPKTDSESPLVRRGRGRPRSGSGSESRPISTKPKQVVTERLKTERAIKRRRRIVLNRLGVTDADMMRAAPIEGVLRKCKGGLPEVETAMKLSISPIIVEFLGFYYQYTPPEREAVPMEAFAVAANINAEVLLSEILIALRQYSVNVVKAIAISGHPDMIKHQMEYAMMPKGERDRHAFNQALGFIPSPKGPTFIGKVMLNRGESEKDDEDEEADLDFLFPSTSETHKKLQTRNVKMIEQGEKEDDQP
jgi:hypothetical protein